MEVNLKIIPHTLHFTHPVGTSRGIYSERKVWYVELSDEIRYGIGECAPLPALSCDYKAIQEWIEDPAHIHSLQETLRKDLAAMKEEANLNSIPVELPSLRFAVEIAYLHFRRGRLHLWDTSFSRGETGIPINGLIWMGSYEEMYHRIREKAEAGFRCLKLKIGALDFEQEIALLRYIRTHFSANEITIRVDANGAFPPGKALEYLQRLAEFELHSIEQPLQAGQYQEMALLCAQSPLPIAFDEELIGIHSTEKKRELLKKLRPQFIVLKPSLHGGVAGSREWIALAEDQGIGWWITSALESNVGLNAIAQFCGLYHPSSPQGLGTGQLFTDNVPSPLYLKGDVMWYARTYF